MVMRLSPLVAIIIPLFLGTPHKGGSQNDFLSVSGASIVYRGNSVKLRGENNNNIQAMYFREPGPEGTGNIADIDTSEGDWIYLGDQGANHIRFGISYHWWEIDPTGTFAALDQQVSWAKQNNMWVVFVLFDTPGGCYEGYSYTCPIWTDSAKQTALINMWKAYAVHYANEPTVAGFDVLNEPTPSDPSEWWAPSTGFAQRIIDGIRSVNTKTLILVECDINGFWGAYPAGTNFTGGNIVYSLHNYIPIALTHTSDTSKSYPGYVVEFGNTVWYDKQAMLGNPAGTTDNLGAHVAYNAQTDLRVRIGFGWGIDNGKPLYLGEWGTKRYIGGHNLYNTDVIDIYLNTFGVSHAHFMWRDPYNGGSFGLTPIHQYPPFMNEQAEFDAIKTSWNGARPSSATNMTAANVNAPVLPSGQIALGQTVAVTNGLWRGFPRPTYAYQWSRDVGGNGVWTDIGGATSSSYTTVTADLDNRIRCRIRATNSGGSADAFAISQFTVVDPSWLPSTLGSALVAWYSARDAATVAASGGRVTQWNDKSGNSRHLTPRASSTAPTYSTTSFNGAAGISWLASEASNLKTANTVPLGGTQVAVFDKIIPGDGEAALSPIIGGERWVGYVASTDSLDWPTGTSASLLLRYSTLNIATSYRGSPTNDYLSQSGFSPAVPHRIGSVYDGTNQTIYVDGVAAGAVANSVTFGATGSFNLGTDGPSSGSSPFQGTMQEIIIMNRAPTLSERSELDYYLR